MSISILKSVLNTIRYFFSRDNSELFENLAGKELLPEQVDGYVEKYADPIVNDFLFFNIGNIETLVRENDVILDIGCGSGRYLKKLQEKYPNVQLCGIDVSANTINNFTKNTVKDAHLAIGDFAINNPWGRAYFNLIYSITVLEYIPFFKIKNFLENIYTALKIGGYLYIQFPHGEDKLDLFKNLSYTRYPVDYVEQKLKSVGFEIIIKKVNTDVTDFGAFIIAKKM